MECNDVEKKIIAGNLNEEEESHILQCQSCRDFAGFHSRLLSEPDAQEYNIMPLEQILSAAGRRKKFTLRFKSLAYTGAAACAIAGFALLLYIFAIHNNNNNIKADIMQTAELDWQSYSSASDMLWMSWDTDMTGITYICADADTPWHVEAYNPFIMEDY